MDVKVQTVREQVPTRLRFRDLKQFVSFMLIAVFIRGWQLDDLPLEQKGREKQLRVCKEIHTAARSQCTILFHGGARDVYLMHVEFLRAMNKYSRISNMLHARGIPFGASVASDGEFLHNYLRHVARPKEKPHSDRCPQILSNQ